MTWNEWSAFFSVYESKTVYNALVILRKNHILLEAELKNRGNTIDEMRNHLTEILERYDR